MQQTDFWQWSIIESDKLHNWNDDLKQYSNGFKCGIPCLSDYPCVAIFLVFFSSFSFSSLNANLSWLKWSGSSQYHLVVYYLESELSFVGCRHQIHWTSKVWFIIPRRGAQAERTSILIAFKRMTLKAFTNILHWNMNRYSEEFPHHADI